MTSNQAADHGLFEVDHPDGADLAIREIKLPAQARETAGLGKLGGSGGSVHDVFAPGPGQVPELAGLGVQGPKLMASSHRDVQEVPIGFERPRGIQGSF